MLSAEGTRVARVTLTQPVRLSLIERLRALFKSHAAVEEGHRSTPALSMPIDAVSGMVQPRKARLRLRGMAGSEVVCSGGRLLLKSQMSLFGGSGSIKNSGHTMLGTDSRGHAHWVAQDGGQSSLFGGGGGHSAAGPAASSTHQETTTTAKNRGAHWSSARQPTTSSGKAVPVGTAGMGHEDLSKVTKGWSTTDHSQAAEIHDNEARDGKTPQHAAHHVFMAANHRRLMADKAPKEGLFGGASASAKPKGFHYDDYGDVTHGTPGAGREAFSNGGEFAKRHERWSSGQHLDQAGRHAKLATSPDSSEAERKIHDRLRAAHAAAHASKGRDRRLSGEALNTIDQHVRAAHATALAGNLVKAGADQ